MEKHLIDWNKITITNNLMFCSVMQDEEICKEFLETMLHIQIDHLEYIKSEDSIAGDIGGKGIRLDVHVKDSDREFDLEMQMTDTHELPLRARFYQSLLDADALDRGQPYDTLKESYVIFICPFDIFGKDLPVYSFENICRESPETSLGDKSHTVFFNIKAWEKSDDEKIKCVLKYFNGEKAESTLAQKIDSKVSDNRFKRQWREQFMTYEQDMAVREKYWYKDGMEAGMEAGAARQKAEDEAIIQEMIQENKNTLQEKDAEIARLKAQLAAQGK